MKARAPFGNKSVSYILRAILIDESALVNNLCSRAKTIFIQRRVVKGRRNEKTNNM